MVLWWVSVICHNDLFYIFINVSHYKIVSLEQGSQTEIATISLSQSQYPIHTALTLPANGHAFHSDPNHVSAARRTLLPHVAPHDVGPAGVRVPRLCLQLVAVPARHELDAIDSVLQHFALSRVWTGIRFISGRIFSQKNQFNSSHEVGVLAVLPVSPVRQPVCVVARKTVPIQA